MCPESDCGHVRGMRIFQTGSIEIRECVHVCVIRAVNDQENESYLGERIES
jgi:hypothetical protein